ncbi:glycosyltransferase family 4 protein [candidate division WOR-3 bacterium]|nr:glycosyltransferase family 4 protein [candidate division WOR-3 bacterium]
MAKKSILIIAPADLSRNDGPKVHIINLVREIKNLGTKVKCILYKPQELNYEPIGAGVEVRFIPNPLFGSNFARIIKYLFIIPVIIWEIFLFKPTIVYFEFTPPVFLYILVLKSLKIFPDVFKITIELHDWVPEQRAIQGESAFKVKIIETFLLGSARMADFIKVVAKGIKDRLKANGVNQEKIAVIGNGTDIELFNPMDRREAKKRIGLKSDYNYVGFIGNFAIWQGLDYLIQAIPHVLGVCDNVGFLLIGDGPEMPKIRKEISRFKNDEVILTGKVPYKEASRYINAFDIGVAPFLEKRNSGMVSPLKICDYAACGVPIVSTRIKGLEIVEEEGIGILVPPDDPEVLADAIIRLLKKPEMREEMGKNGRKIAKEQFSWKLIAKKTLELFF